MKVVGKINYYKFKKIADYLQAISVFMCILIAVQFMNWNINHVIRFKPNQLLSLTLRTPSQGLTQWSFQYLNLMPPFPLVSWACWAECSWHVSCSLSRPKQPLYQNYPRAENQFVYLWRVLHIRHVKLRFTCSFTGKTSAGLKCVEEVDHCQQAKEKIRGDDQSKPPLTVDTSVPHLSYL